MGFQELSYKGPTRAVFCVAKAQDTKHASKQRVSDLLNKKSDRSITTVSTGILFERWAFLEALFLAQSKMRRELSVPVIAKPGPTEMTRG